MGRAVEQIEAGGVGSKAWPCTRSGAKVVGDIERLVRELDPEQLAGQFVKPEVQEEVLVSIDLVAARA